MGFGKQIQQWINAFCLLGKKCRDETRAFISLHCGTRTSYTRFNERVDVCSLYPSVVSCKASCSLFFPFPPLCESGTIAATLLSFLPREHILCDVYIIGLLLHHLHIQHETVAIMDMDIDSHGCYGNGPTRAMGDSRGFRA